MLKQTEIPKLHPGLEVDLFSIGRALTRNYSLKYQSLKAQEGRFYGGCKREYKDRVLGCFWWILKICISDQLCFTTSSPLYEAKVTGTETRTITRATDQVEGVFCYSGVCVCARTHISVCICVYVWILFTFPGNVLFPISIWSYQDTTDSAVKSTPAFIYWWINLIVSRYDKHIIKESGLYFK